MSELTEGNKALREKKYVAAIAHYVSAFQDASLSIQEQPYINEMIAQNISRARKKYRLSDSGIQQPQIIICGWNLAHNNLSRVHTFAKYYQSSANTMLISCFSQKSGGNSLRESNIPTQSLALDDEKTFLNRAIKWVANNPCDRIHLINPRIPNILLGILYKLIWNATVLIDIDAKESGYMDQKALVGIDEYLKQQNTLPEFKNPDDKNWTRLALGLTQSFDGVTVSDAAMQKRYGGEIVSHDLKKLPKSLQDSTGSPLKKPLFTLLKHLPPARYLLSLISDHPIFSNQSSSSINTVKKVSNASSVSVKRSSAENKQTNKNSNASSNILFILPGAMESNSGYQVQLLAKMIEIHGFHSIIAVPDSCLPNESYDETTPTASSEGFHQDSTSTIISYTDLSSFNSTSFPEIIHAWTPREKVRKVCEKLLEQHKSRLVIHLEDNEEYLTEITVGHTWDELCGMSDMKLDSLIPGHRYHPRKGRAFLDKADGLTMVIDTLNRFNTKNLPYEVIPPLVDERLFYPRPINRDLRRKHGIPDDHIVLVYTGNVHDGNRDEVRELYQAVHLLNEQGCATTILRTGNNVQQLGDENWITAHEKHLGWVHREELPQIMAAADVFVQPGLPGPFNDERVPSKLPEYFAMGRPVILPKSNLGLKLLHAKEGYAVKAADANTIMKAVMEIKKDPRQAGHMAAGGSMFIKCCLSASKTVDKLVFFYLEAFNCND